MAVIGDAKELEEVKKVILSGLYLSFEHHGYMYSYMQEKEDAMAEIEALKTRLKVYTYNCVCITLIRSWQRKATHAGSAPNASAVFVFSSKGEIHPRSAGDSYPVETVPG